MANLVYIATSIDGFIATKNNGLEWLERVENPSGSDFGYGAFMESIDALVMGRNTYDVVKEFEPWPYSKPVFVLTHRPLDKVPQGVNLERIEGSAQSIVTQLKEHGHVKLYIDGGQTINFFLEADLIDEMIISTVPVLLGNGIRLFRESSRVMQDFSINSVKSYDNALIKVHYLRKN